MSKSANEVVFACIKLPVKRKTGYKNMLRQDFIFQMDNENSIKDMDCCICLNKLISAPDVVFLRKCKHQFHLTCLKDIYLNTAKLKCPLCRLMYRLEYGNCLEGVLEVKTSGDEMRMHFKISEFNCIICLKNNDEGKCLMNLLMKSWQRQLLDRNILESFQKNNLDNKLDVIKSTLEDLNVFENKLNENLDDTPDEIPENKYFKKILETSISDLEVHFGLRQPGDDNPINYDDDP
ncbi:hypothetical protein HELRODRAFT_172679 [Helobdella robusta]|uniref:E3 ubiquitin-protein ligase n=1 Tax=Helobdella robusta TaxID=6412 RepID=T1F5S0_HELRO|nr:hypothetical protein HELRODRAFT_172679 [Helobdella robusta]ESO04319.1 hypothetical protein HELRODRAFT_172679 [Helobdella robusta]